MAHLIAPVTVEGTPYCTSAGSTSHTAARKWRTPSVLTGLAALQAVEDDDAWTVPAAPDTSGSGTVIFGTCCISTVTFQAFYSGATGSTDPAAIEIYLNGSGTPSATFYVNSDTPVDCTIDLGSLGLRDRPCGNIFRCVLNFDLAPYSHAYDSLRLQISDVT